MRRISSVIGLAPESIDEYQHLHAAVWPAVLDRLTASNISNYSIFRHDDLLFAYMEYTGDDYEKDTAAIAADPATRRWWAVCEPLQRPLAERVDGEWWTTIPEVFHLD